jgi:hypothetical protein
MPLWVNLAIFGWFMVLYLVTRHVLWAFAGLGWMIGYGIYLGITT